MIKKIYKFIAFSFLGLIVIVALGVGGYSGYENYKLNQELTYETEHKCLKHDYQTQLCTTSEDDLYLRRVDLSKGEIAMSTLDETDRYTYSYYWPAACEDGTRIETDQTYSGGETVSLNCVSFSSGKTYIFYGFGSSSKR